MSSVYDSRACSHGEGPLWHPVRKQLFWFDIPAGKLLSRLGNKALEWQFEEMVSAAGWIDRDRLLIASESSLFTFNLATEEARELVPLEADKLETRPNDGRADPWGGFWISTMGKHAEPNAGAIYRLYRGQLRRIVGGLTIPNAICFAPDRSVAYYTDTPTRQVLAQPLGRDGWPEGAPRVAIDLTADQRDPDGAVTDAEGHLWIAEWSAGRVARYTADGQFLGSVEVGARQCSCPAFGGVGLDRLFITTSQEGMNDRALVADPQAGQVFVVDLEVRGLPEPAVRL